jgi:hypothetical protein
MPSRKGLKRLGKRWEWLHDQNGGAKKREVATRIRSKPKVLKRGEVKIVSIWK